ncbi:hypothetical protein ACFRK5_10915 [Streptomyces niveus]|uniref:hypothetical protein n=1 Tax=Streptomyces niveus TaxID=193462 RepID=UPI0036BD5CC5
MNLTPILADAADKMFDTLVEYANQLQDATDRGITFTIDGNPAGECTSPQRTFPLRVCRGPLHGAQGCRIRSLPLSRADVHTGSTSFG